MLRHGCNDFGGTLYEESITRESGGPHGERLAPDEIRSWIRSVQKKPRQRTTLYGPVAGDEAEAGEQGSGAQLMNRTAPVVTS
jgi:FO synthase